MKASELIAKLQEVIKAEGDNIVYMNYTIYDDYGNSLRCTEKIVYVKSEQEKTQKQINLY